MPPPPKRENLLASIVCNVVLPTVILSRLSKPEWFGPQWGLVVALAFPVGYFAYDYSRRRKANFVSILGFTSVLLTGVLGLVKASLMTFAIKEAAVPLVIGAGVLLSMGTKRPLVNEMLYNDQVIDVPKVDAALAERGTRPDFQYLLRSSSWLLAGSFLMSAGLNFVLARHFLQSAPGTSEFNEELGKMNLWSWPVIVVPTMLVTVYALWRLLHGIGTLTGLKTDEILHSAPAADDVPRP